MSPGIPCGQQQPDQTVRCTCTWNLCAKLIEQISPFSRQTQLRLGHGEELLRRGKSAPCLTIRECERICVHPAAVVPRLNERIASVPCRVQYENGFPGIQHRALQGIIVEIVRGGIPARTGWKEADIGAADSNSGADGYGGTDGVEGTIPAHLIPAPCRERLSALVEFRQRCVVSLRRRTDLCTHRAPRAELSCTCEVMQKPKGSMRRCARPRLCREERLIPICTQPVVRRRRRPRNGQCRLHRRRSRDHDKKRRTSEPKMAEELRHSPAVPHAAHSVPMQRTRPCR